MTEIIYPQLSEARISAIITIWAGDRLDYFNAALSSLLGQLLRPIEIIVVADGQLPDEHYEFLQKIQLNHPSIKVLQMDSNQGVSNARNIGIAAANGDWIAIMDADDISSPQRFIQQFSFAKYHDYDVVSSNYEIINEHSQTTGKRVLPESMEKILQYAPFFCPLANPAVLGKKWCFVNHPYNSKLSYAEDYDIWISMLKGGVRLGNAPALLLQYRQGDNFLLRRRGLGKAFSELKVRIKAISLVPRNRFPAYLFNLLAMFCFRVMPGQILGILYKKRHLLEEK